MKYHFLVILASVLVAGSFLASAKLADVVNPVSLTLLRFAAAALLLLPVILFNPFWRNKVFTTMPRAMVISLFYSLFFIGFFESLKTTTALNAATLYTLVPLLTALLCLFVFRDSITFMKLFVYLLGAAGTCWVIFNGQIALFLSFSLNIGDLIFIMGTFSMCCYSVSMKLLYRNDDMLVLVFCILLGGSLWMALALLISGQPLQWDLIQGESVWYMAYLVIGATLATVYLYQKTTVVLGPGRVNAYIYLNPAFVAVLLLFIDGISIPLVVVPGIIISSVATFFLQRDNNDKKC